MEKKQKFVKITLTDEQKTIIMNATGATKLPSSILIPIAVYGEIPTIKNVSEDDGLVPMGCCHNLVGGGCTGQDDDEK